MRDGKDPGCLNSDHPGDTQQSRRFTTEIVSLTRSWLRWGHLDFCSGKLTPGTGIRSHRRRLTPAEVPGIPKLKRIK